MRKGAVAVPQVTLKLLRLTILMIISKLKKFINLIRRNPKVYPLELFVFNIFRPSRFITRLKNNRTGRFKIYSLLDKSSYYSPSSLISPIIKYDHFDNENTMDLALKSLKINGAVVIDSFHNEEIIDEFSNAYEKEFSEIKNLKNIRFNELKLTNELFKIWLNPWIYKLLSRYYGMKPYCSNYPEIWHVDTSNSLEKLASDWHIDHCSKTGLQHYLHDIKPDCSTTEILLGSHKLPNLPRTFDDYWIRNSGFEIFRLHGKKGSVQIHDPNVIHRAGRKIGSSRTSIGTVFSWGENIKFSAKRLANTVRDSDIDIESLPFSQREALIGLYPKMPFKGYEITKNGFISPQRRLSM